MTWAATEADRMTANVITQYQAAGSPMSRNAPGGSMRDHNRPVPATPPSIKTALNTIVALSISRFFANGSDAVLLRTLKHGIINITTVASMIESPT